jgi:hypothetical protein
MGNEPGREKERRNGEKMFFLTERTQGFSANKGLTIRRMLKAKALLMPNERKLMPKSGRKAPFVWPRSVVCGLKKRRRARLTGGLDDLRIQPPGIRNPPQRELAAGPNVMKYEQEFAAWIRTHTKCRP